tara:strand:+ start:190 stop:573 length:384 start_codon:yes stop_codon:yes gene_type:complete
MSTLKTGKVKTTTIADELDTESTAVTNVINGSAKAWVDYDRTNSTVKASFNVSSVTDNGTARWVVTYLTPMPSANYSYAVTGVLYQYSMPSIHSKTATQIDVRIGNQFSSTTSLVNTTSNSVVVFSN